MEISAAVRGYMGASAEAVTASRLSHGSTSRSRWSATTLRKPFAENPSCRCGPRHRSRSMVLARGGIDGDEGFAGDGQVRGGGAKRSEAALRVHVEKLRWMPGTRHICLTGITSERRGPSLLPSHFNRCD